FSLVNISCTTKGKKGSEINPPNSASHHKADKKQIYLADPTIFYYDGVYYLYGTHTVNKGFVVYTSTNLKDWEGPAGAEDGFALRKEDVYGKGDFWAPQVFEYHGTFYM